jgi:hypothetical protein
MRVELHPAALQEIIDSARYYENRLPGLGIDFKSEVGRTLDLLSENPARIFPKQHSESRVGVYRID